MRVALGRATAGLPPQQFAALGFSSLGRAGRDKPKLQLARVPSARRAEPEHRTQAGRRKYVVASSPWRARSIQCWTRASLTVCAHACAALPLYLVIYAPRRGILEVWHMRHGSRVGILDVGVDGYAPTTTT